MHLKRGRARFKFPPIPGHYERGWHLVTNSKLLGGLNVDEMKFHFLLNSLQAFPDLIIQLLQKIQNKQFV